MPIWLAIVAGAGAIGYMLDKGGEAVDATANATKWGVAAGGLYVAYRVAKTQGVIK